MMENTDLKNRLSSEAAQFKEMQLRETEVESHKLQQSKMISQLENELSTLQALSAGRGQGEGREVPKLAQELALGVASALPQSPDSAAVSAIISSQRDR